MEDLLKNVLICYNSNAVLTEEQLKVIKKFENYEIKENNIKNDIEMGLGDRYLCRINNYEDIKDTLNELKILIDDIEPQVIRDIIKAKLRNILSFSQSCKEDIFSEQIVKLWENIEWVKNEKV